MSLAGPIVRVAIITRFLPSGSTPQRITFTVVQSNATDVPNSDRKRLRDFLRRLYSDRIVRACLLA